MRHFLLLIAFAFASVVTCHAQTESAEDKRNVSITISPLHLLFPVVELTGEYKVARKTGMAVIAGVGSIDVLMYDGVFTFSTHTFTVFELGTSLRYYLIGDFDHGMQVGGELLYAHVSGDFAQYDVEGIGNGLAIGPFLGYKVAFGFGLTLELQGGAQYVMATARAEQTSTGQSSSASADQLVPLINANLGWTF